MKKHLKRLRESKAARNAAASYLAFISTTVTGLISIPLAVHFLTKEEMGLWAVISVSAGYLNFMELGLGHATGRKMADGIVAKDKFEIDRWWTLSRIVLAVQGILIVLIGLAFTPLFMSQMAAGFPDQRQAAFLVVTMVVIQGIKLPFLGVEGILIAQERFHWIPLRQSLIFWAQLAAFAAGLFSGFGLYSMLWAEVATLIVAWSLNWALLARSEPRLGWDTSGLQWARIRSLFGFSLNIACVGILEGVVKSLPVMILGKVGGLALVPVYTLSVKVSTVLSSLGKRNYHSFYPALQRIFIEGNHAAFRAKFSSVGILTVATGLGIAGFILCFNRTAVEMLAKPEFYAGPLATTWFAVATITIPISGFLQLPLLAAGKMGKSVLASIFQLALGFVTAYFAFERFGIEGLAATAALLPLCMGAYGYFRGAKECGANASELSGKTVLWGIAAVFIVISSGSIITIFDQPQQSIDVYGKSVSVPGMLQIAVGGGICLAASALFVWSLYRIKKVS
jgi:O-antigen/teichoic acid export membrane protein